MTDLAEYRLIRRRPEFIACSPRHGSWRFDLIGCVLSFGHCCGWSPLSLSKPRRGKRGRFGHLQVVSGVRKSPSCGRGSRSRTGPT